MIKEKSNRWEKFLKILEKNKEEDQVSRYLLSVEKEYQYIVALALCAAKWAPETVDRRSLPCALCIYNDCYDIPCRRCFLNGGHYGGCLSTKHSYFIWYSSQDNSKKETLRKKMYAEIMKAFKQEHKRLEKKNRVWESLRMILDE
jgi:hypothetical protein